MSAESELANLARAYGWVNADGRSATLDANGLDLALSARAQTLLLCSRVLRSAGVSDTSGLHASRRPRRLLATRVHASTLVRALEQHPVSTFVILLEHYPRTELPLSLSDYAAQEPQNVTEKAWHRIQALAVSAYDLWEKRVGSMSPDQEWDAIRDITAITRVLVHIDRQLSLAAENPQVRPDVQSCLKQTQYTWLRVAADEVDRLASQPGPPGPLRSEPRASVRTLPVHVRSPEALLEGQRHLAALIAAEPQTPNRVALLARAHRGIIDRYSRVLPAAPAWAAQARESLATLPLREGELATLANLRAPSTMVQLREIQRYLARAPREKLRHIADAGLAAAAATLTSLAEVTDKEVGGTSWVISHGDAIDRDPKLRWQPVRTARTAPPRLATILHAVRATVSDAAQLPAPRSKPRIERAATILAEAVNEQAKRPKHPADLPQHARGSTSTFHLAALREHEPPPRPLRIGDPPQPAPFPNDGGGLPPPLAQGPTLDL